MQGAAASTRNTPRAMAQRGECSESIGTGTRAYAWGGTRVGGVRGRE